MGSMPRGSYADACLRAKPLRAGSASFAVYDFWSYEWEVTNLYFVACVFCGAFGHKDKPHRTAQQLFLVDPSP